MNEFMAQRRDDLEEKSLIVLGSTSFTLWNNASNQRFNMIFKELKGVNLAEQMKFRSSFGGNTTSINMESLLELDPDLIFINPHS
jgi:ABC-type Fe3+-hydroxamate transport system substrate-binding protein